MHNQNNKLKSVKAIAEQAAWMAVAAGLVVPSLAVLPVTLALRNYREKLPQDKKDTHPVAKVHEFLAGVGVFAAFTLIQGPEVIFSELKNLKTHRR